MKLGPRQQPWIASIPAFEQRVVTSADETALLAAIAAELSARPLEECFIGIDGDHGYWREEHLYRSGSDVWLLSFDSHRSVHPPAPLRPGAIDKLLGFIQTNTSNLLPHENKIMHLHGGLSKPPGIIVWYRRASDNLAIFIQTSQYSGSEPGGDELMAAYWARCDGPSEAARKEIRRSWWQKLISRRT